MMMFNLNEDNSWVCCTVCQIKNLSLVHVNVFVQKYDHDLALGAVSVLIWDLKCYCTLKHKTFLVILSYLSQKAQ